MGQVSDKKIVLLIILFLASALLTKWKPESVVARKTNRIRHALGKIGTWRSGGFCELDAKIVEALALDDYVNQLYIKEQRRVFLYVGYYFTSKKIGAAHDPLVCFPGQGWVLSERSEGMLNLEGKNDDIISYSSMIAQKGGQKELLVYWFQSYDRTNASTISQKLSLLLSRRRKRGEDNAFVRITVSVEDNSLDEAYETAFDFIRQFYPLLLEYVRE